MAYKKLNKKANQAFTAEDLAHIEQGISEATKNQAPAEGALEELENGRAMTGKLWSAKTIADFVKAEVAKASAG